MPVWDGTRPATPRTVLSAEQVSARGMDFNFVSEEIAAPTDWCFQESHHVVVVHRSGHLQSMESEFASGPTGQILPRVGDVWVIPAEHRYAALAKGSTAGFCEIAIPTTALGAPTMAPQIGRRDEFLYALTGRLAGLVQRDDVMARLMRDSVAETVRLHLSDNYTDGEAVARLRRRRTLGPTMRRSLIEFLETNLDAEISLAAMADHVEMSVAELMRCFADTFGTTPHQFLVERRIDRAKAMLADRRLTITEIGYAVGFSTPSHFATTFKQRVGVTPSAYRAAIRM